VNDKGQLTASTRLLAGLGAGVRLKIFLSWLFSYFRFD
jgi:hypothetical protein